MKKIFILFLFISFYNIQASENNKNQFLPSDMQSLQEIIRQIFTYTNRRPYILISREINGQKQLVVQSGLIDSNCYTLIYPEGHKEIESLKPHLPDQSPDERFNNLIQIITLKEKGLLTIPSSKPQVTIDDLIDKNLKKRNLHQKKTHKELANIIKKNNLFPK